MTRFLNPILFACSLFIASAAAGGEYSDLYIIPAVSHAQGAYGTFWRSDVVLHNIQAVPITVEMALVETGRPASTAPIAIVVGGETALHLSPGETRIVADVVGQQGRDLAGALIVGADLPFALTSRTSAESAAGRTLGQTVRPMAIGGSADTIDGVSVLAGLSVDERRRSNAGAFIAASHAPLVVEIELVSPSGAPLGSRILAIEEPGFVHHQWSISDLAGIAAGATAVVRVLQGAGVVVPYASMIDNRSAEAIFVAGEPVAAQGAAARIMLSQAVRTGDR